jgi:pimeloyl-ACP methyl ester carboxylesterase
VSLPTVPLYREITGSGPDLVLLHGGGGSIEDLGDLRDRLQRSHRVIAPDQRLHGRSPDPGDISYPLMAADTAALLDELGVRGADLVGWSDGGVIALLIARDRPDLVRRVATMGANVGWREGHPADVLTDSAISFFERLWADPSAWPKPDAFPGTEAEWQVVLQRLVGIWRTPPGITLADLESISAPVLLLAGETDVVRLDHTVAMRDALQNGSFGVVPGASHGLPQEQPEIVVALVEWFLASN